MNDTGASKVAAGRPECPTPTKRRYKNRHDATVEAMLIESRNGYRLYSYQCACGAYHHATRGNGKSLETEGMTPDQQFTLIVRRDLSGRATVEESAYLRSADNLDRWLEELTKLRIDLRNEFRSKPLDGSVPRAKWHEGLKLLRARVSVRRQEAKKLMRKMSDTGCEQR